MPTSPYVQDFAACVGYAMVGLGTYFDPAQKFDLGFRHGVGNQYAFRGLSSTAARSDILERDLKALQLPGLGFRRVSVTGADGKLATGVYVEITDWDDWNPTELSFHLMALASKYRPANPLANLRNIQQAASFATWGRRNFTARSSVTAPRSICPRTSPTGARKPKFTNNRPAGIGSMTKAESGSSRLGRIFWRLGLWPLAFLQPESLIRLRLHPHRAVPRELRREQQDPARCLRDAGPDAPARPA